MLGWRVSDTAPSADQVFLQLDVVWGTGLKGGRDGGAQDGVEWRRVANKGTGQPGLSWNMTIIEI